MAHSAIMILLVGRQPSTVHVPAALHQRPSGVLHQSSCQTSVSFVDLFNPLSISITHGCTQK